VWGGMLDCNSSPTYLLTLKVTHIYQTLCCRITTINLYIFNFSDFNMEPASSLKMIWIMIETCWSVY